MQLRKCLQLEENGLQVAQAYYEAYGREAMQKQLPEYADRIAYGLVGEGSECYGFDDKISTDHDYGPSFCMWLTHEDFVKAGARARLAYQSLPPTFKGHPARVNLRTAMDRVGALDMDMFYGKFLGRPTVPTDALEWIRIPEQYLAVATNGRIFEDKLGAFSAIRKQLLAFYPEDVRKKKIATKAIKMAHSGQCNYARLMRRGDIVAAQVAVNEFIENAIKMLYLLNKKYAPYYKWMFRGLYELPRLRPCVDLIEKLAGCGSTLSAWSDDNIVLDFFHLNTADTKVELMEAISAQVAAELQRQGLSDCEDSYLEGHAYSVMQHIEDERVQRLNIMLG